MKRNEFKYNIISRKKKRNWISVKQYVEVVQRNLISDLTFCESEKYIFVKIYQLTEITDNSKDYSLLFIQQLTLLMYYIF